MNYEIYNNHASAFIVFHWKSRIAKRVESTKPIQGVWKSAPLQVETTVLALPQAETKFVLQ